MRSVCKKNKTCDRLHQYDLQRMPHCRFFTSGCLEPACIYQARATPHPTRLVVCLMLCQHKDDNQDDRGNCTFYARGFCKNGPRCSRNHNTQARSLSFTPLPLPQPSRSRCPAAATVP